MKDFVNCHLHTEFSLQDSVIKIPDLIETLKANNQQACAITDHGSLAGQFEFYEACKQNNIKPILGCEFYVLPDGEKSKNRQHLVLLAKNEEGLKNLRKLQKISLDKFYYKPIVNFSDIYENTEGLFLSTACSLGPISQALINRDYELARDYLNQFLDNFGKDNVALEFQFHPEYTIQSTINEELLKLYDDFDIKYTIATCDSHFLNNEDRDVRKIIQAISWQKSYGEVRDSLKSNCFGTGENVLEFARETEFSDPKLVEKMISDTNKIANLCKDDIEFISSERKIPGFNRHAELKAMLDKQL